VIYKSYRPERIGDITRHLKAWVIRNARAVQRQAQMNAPRSTGLMAKTISVVPTFPKAYVATNVPYSWFVEGYPQTTRRHFVPWDKYPAMERWARRHGFKTRRKDGSVSRGGLMVWGYATKFFQNAVNQVRPQAMQELQRRLP
jgi:hypothetical protein